jgi:hypothetical protein
MLCPWCLHYGAEDEEYLFDSELYCGLCAQQPPDSDEDWERALLAMDGVALSYIEEELNHIAVSKSGLQPELLAEMGEGLELIRRLRESVGEGRRLPPDAQQVRWLRFACTYFAPRLR